MCTFVYFFFFKQKTAYEMRISDWSSDVCSSDLDDRDIGKNPALQYIFLPVEDFHFLALGNLGADSGLCIKSGNSGPTRAAPFSQRSLRAKFHFEFAGQILALEFLVLTYIGADHFLDLPRAQQLAQPFIVDARIIGCDGKILDPR